MKRRRTSFKYPFSKKRVFFSCALIAITMGFTFSVLTNPLSILLFFVYTLLLTAVFLVLKFHLYLMKMEEKLESPFLREEHASQQKKTLSRSVITLLILLIFGLLLPFSLLLFFSPFTWFISITGFIAAINIPEIVLYIYAQKVGKRMDGGQKLE